MFIGLINWSWSWGKSKDFGLGMEGIRFGNFIISNACALSVKVSLPET